MVVAYVGDGDASEALEFWGKNTKVRCVVLLVKGQLPAPLTWTKCTLSLKREQRLHDDRCDAVLDFYRQCLAQVMRVALGRICRR